MQLVDRVSETLRRTLPLFMFILAALASVTMPVLGIVGAITVSARTDRYTYTAGDSVTVSVIIQVPYLPPTLPASVRLFFTTPGGTQIRDVGTQGYNSWLSHTVTGVTFASGSYSVRAEAAVEENTYSSSAVGFTVTGPSPGAITVEVRTDRSTYNVGDPVTASVEIHVPYVPPSYPARVLLIFSTPSGTQSRDVGTQGYNSWAPHTVAGMTTVAGSYSVRADATVGGTTHSSSSVSFIVSGAPPFDFSIALSPSSQTVAQGGGTTFQISAHFSNPVWIGTPISIQAVGLDSTMSWSYSWSSQTSGSLYISTSPSTPTRTYTITAIGSARGVSHQASVFLTVVGGAPAFDFSVSVSPSPQTVTPGGSTSYSVLVSLVSGSPTGVSLSLSGFPSEVTYSFSSTSGTPSFFSALTIYASPSAPVGSYVLVVAASGGGVTRTTSATLIVNAVGDFGISASPSTASATQNDRAYFTVNVNLVGIFDQIVSLSISGLPSGTSPSFSLTSGRPSFTSTLIIDISSSVPVGEYSLAIDATGGGVIRTTRVTLKIEQMVRHSSSLAIATSMEDGRVRLTGSLTPAVAGALVTLNYIAPDRLMITRDTMVAPDGSFTDSYYPHPAGYWTVVANWQGNENYEPATSWTIGFTVPIVVTTSQTTVVSTVTSVSVLTTTSVPPSRCLIASAAYGSNMAPEVQFLREFRDSSVKATFAGSAFMDVFNRFYYSFSPIAASFIAQHPLAQGTVRRLLSPLVAALQWTMAVFENLDSVPELAIVASGIVVAALIGMVYLTPLIGIAVCVRARRKK